MPPLRGRVYLAALLAVLAAGVVDLGVRVYELWLPSTPPFSIGTDGGTPVFADPASDAPVRSGDELVALAGTPAPEDATMSAVHEMLVDLGRARTVEAVVRDTATGAERRVTLALDADEASETGFDFFFSGWLLLGAALGLLVLRAREGSGAVRRYVELTLVTLGPVCLLVLIDWRDTVLVPWSQAGAYTTPAEDVIFTTVLVCPFLIGWFAIRFLHAFPSPSPELCDAFPVPRFSRFWRWILWSLAAVMLGTMIGEAAGLPPGRTRSIWIPAFAAAAIVATLMLPAWLWNAILTTFRLARRRLETAAPEEAARVRLALQGVRLGALLFALMGVAIVVVIGLEIADVDIEGIEHFFALLLATALVAPFLGMALAILRGGLWDVDLIVRRATLFTALGALFVGAWLGFEMFLEAFVPEGAFGLGPALAAVAVATAGRPLSRSLTRRFFPAAVDFPAAVERVSERLGAAAHGDDPAARIGRALAEVLELERCAVAPPNGAGDAAGPPGGPGFRHPAPWDASPVLSGASPLLEGGAPAVMVRTDDGPLLVLGIGPDPGSGPVVVVGGRAGGYFYGPDEIRLLRVLLNPLAGVLAGARAAG